MAITDKITDIADAIREQTGSTAKMSMPQMASNIRGFNVSKDVDNTTVFKKDGSIEQTYTDGTVIATVFNADESITVTTKKNGAVIRTEKTVFNADGSITVTYKKGAN